MNVQKMCAFALFSLAIHNVMQPDMPKLDTKKTLIVTISGQTLVQKSKAGQKMQKKLQAEQEQLSKPLQNDDKLIRTKEKELQDKKRALDKEAEEINSSKLLSQEAKQRKYEEIQDKVRILEEDKAELERLIKRLQADAKRLETKMSQLYQEEMAKLDAKIRDCIKAVAEREGWDIVFMEESGIIYASPAVSKTDMMIKELDALDKKEEDVSLKKLKKEVADLDKEEPALKKLKTETVHKK